MLCFPGVELHSGDGATVGPQPDDPSDDMDAGLRGYCRSQNHRLAVGQEGEVRSEGTVLDIPQEQEAQVLGQ